MTQREKNLEKLKEFRNLKDNWNEHNAKPFNEVYLIHVRNLINSIDENLQPEIFPIASNHPRVQFEWKREDLYIEIQIYESDIHDLYFKYKGIESYDIRIECEYKDLNALLKLLLRGYELEKVENDLKGLTLQKAEYNGKEVYFIDERVKLPENTNLYKYEIRHDDRGFPVEISEKILADFYGTIISKEKIELPLISEFTKLPYDKIHSLVITNEKVTF